MTKKEDLIKRLEDAKNSFKKKVTKKLRDLIAEIENELEKIENGEMK